MSDQVIVESSSEDTSDTSDSSDGEEDSDVSDSIDYSDDYEQVDNDESSKTSESDSTNTEEIQKIEEQNGRNGSKCSSVPSLQASKMSSRVSSGQESTNGMDFSINTRSFLSTITSQQTKFHRKQNSYVKQRISSAKRNSRNDLINTLAALKFHLEDLKNENMTLKHVSIRQDKELNRFTSKEGELPVILSANKEETKVVKMKMKQIQDANRELGSKLKEKDAQVLRLKEVNKELRRINKNTNGNDKTTIKEGIQEVKTQLANRDKEFQDLLRRQDVLEKSHRRQLMTEIKKKQALKKQLQTANEQIYALDKAVKEKEKQVHRLNIYSNRKQNHLKQSVSTGNIHCVGSDDFVTKLGSKLSLLKTQEEAFEIIEEKQEDKSNLTEEKEENKKEDEVRESNENILAAENTEAETVIKSESEDSENASTKSERDETERVTVDDEKEEVVNDPANKSQEETPRSNHTMSPQEKVSLWLPTNQPDYEELAENTIEEDVSFTPVPAERKSLQKEANFRSNTPSPSPSMSIQSEKDVHNNEKDEESIDKEKKSNLMKDLFGEDSFASDMKEGEDTPLKTAIRTSSASSKSVKFNDDSMDTVKFNDDSMETVKNITVGGIDF